MDGTSYFPSRPEMEANLAAFAERARPRRPLRLPLDRRHACSTSRPDGDRFEVETTDGAYRCRHARPRGRGRRAVHAARARHGARLPLRRRASGRDLRRPARLHHRQAELRVRAGQRAAAVGAPADPGLAVAREALGRHEVAGRRPGPLRPAVRGLRPGRRRRDPRCGDRPRRTVRRRRARSSTSDGPTAAATCSSRSTTSSPRPGSSRPCGDLPDLGRDDVRGEPAAGRQTPWWESATRARHLLRRDHRARAAKGLQRARHCRPTPARSTGRATTPGCWRGHIAATRFGVEVARPAVGARRRRGPPGRELAEATRRSSTSAAISPGVLTVDPAGGFRDEGIQPLAHVLDSGGADARRRDPRGGRDRRHLPHPLHPQGRFDRRAPDRSGSAGSPRCQRCPSRHRGRARQALSAMPLIGPGGGTRLRARLAELRIRLSGE